MARLLSLCRLSLSPPPPPLFLLPISLYASSLPCLLRLALTRRAHKRKKIVKCGERLFPSFIFLRCSTAARLANYPTIRTAGYPAISLRLSLLLPLSETLVFTHLPSTASPHFVPCTQLRGVYVYTRENVLLLSSYVSRFSSRYINSSLYI